MSLALSQTAPKPGVIRTLGTAIGSGVAVLLVGEAVWLRLIAAYAQHPTPFPWFVPAMALLLGLAAAWMIWRSRSDRRHWSAYARLNAVPLRSFGLALIAGWSTFFAGAGAYIAYRMQSGLGGEVPMTLPPGPKSAIIAGLAMAAIVAGTIEEISVRGFIQGRLEKAFGLVPAIAVSGLVWGLFHTNHSYFDTTALDVAIWLGIFMTVSAMLGTIAQRTNSVLPGMVVHAGFDATYFVAAGILQPKIAPLAFLESLAAPHAFAAIGGGLAVVALIAWIALFRATRRP